MAAPGLFGRRERGEKKERQRVTKKGWRTAKKMFRYVMPYKWIFLVGMIFLVGSTATSLGFPYILGQMVNSATGVKDWWLSEVDSIAIMLGLLILGQMIFSFLRVYTFSLVTQRAMADIRYDLYAKMMTLPMVFFEKRRVGELTSRVTADVSQLQTVLSISLAELFRQIATLIGGVAFILIISPRLTLFMVAIFPPLILITVFFGRFIRKHSRKTQDDLATTNVVVEESLHNISIIKAFTNEWFELNRYKKSLTEVVRNAIRTDTFRGLLISFVIFSIFGSIVLVIWYGGHMVMDGNLAIGDLFTFILFMVFIGGSLGGLPDVFSQIIKAVGATERLKEILDETPEAELAAEGTAIGSIRGEITYDDVRFNYPTREDVEVLKGISFRVAAGEKVALAGSSGAGKSTITQLLMRFYQLKKGDIKVDGKSINDYPLHQLRSHIGIVPQEVILFGGTIRENIAYGRLEASEADIRSAAQQANALNFIMEFPEGLDTVVGERGVKLSGGQRQRLAIARAILKDPAILLLDEATSSLDAESEKVVQDALDKLMENRTTIIIAHRLGTIRNVDRIYVLDNGRIVESGSHAELTSDPDGVYNKLVQLQMQRD